MILSDRFIRDAKDIFVAAEPSDSYVLRKELSLDSNNVFNRSLIVEINSNSLEIPVIAKRHIERKISSACVCQNVSNGRVILPLYNNADDAMGRSFNSIIRQFFSRTGYDKRLKKITTSKGEVYYGGRGIIFDESYTPLLLCVAAGRIKYIASDKINISYHDLICYVSPKVFLNTNNIINRGIIKHLIPLYTTTRTSFCDFNSTLSIKDTTVKVIVEDLDRFFIEPIRPFSVSNINDSLNECLINNMDDIITTI